MEDCTSIVEVLCFKINADKLAFKAGMVSSVSEAKRVREQGGMELVVEDERWMLKGPMIELVMETPKMHLRVGKKWVAIV